ncbi:MAG: acyltransferase [Rubrivivax sp.]|nr:acyltransferase [Rubrivivax sp.]
MTASPVQRRPALDAGVSLYLDLARVSAALLVLLHHVFEPPFHAAGIHLPGRSAVIVFFVISGFVIAYATDGQTDARRYAVARAARIYSVAVPALVLTGVLHAAGLWLWGAEHSTFDRPVLRLLLSLGFVNQLWNLTIAPLENGPYWSLCYEVWYYVAFGAFMFLRGRSRWLLLAAVLLVCGPRILLLAPPWVLGVLVYRQMQGDRGAAAPSSHRQFCLWSALFLLALFGYNPADLVSQAVAGSLDDGYWRVLGLPLFIGGDWRFPSDWLLALLFAMSLRHAAGVFPRGVTSGGIGRGIREASAYTFSLYLYHAPLLVFMHPALRAQLPPAWLPWVTTGVLVALVVALGHVTERRKEPWVRLFARLLGARGSRAQGSDLPVSGAPSTDRSTRRAIERQAPVD